MAAELEEQKEQILAGLRGLVTQAGSVEELVPKTIAQLFPNLAEHVKAAPLKDQWRKGDPDSFLLQSCMHELGLALVTEAVAAGQPPLTYVPPHGAAHPVVPTFLSAALYMCEHNYAEPVLVVLLLEELLEFCTIDHAAAVFDWLDCSVDRLRVLPVPNNNAWRLPLLRSCNALLRRLSKARDAVLGARVLLLLARVQTLAERSGVNNTCTVGVSPVLVEEVPEGAVDSEGQAVDAELYTTFWGLQKALQEPRELSSIEQWTKARTAIQAVVKAFAEQPTAVAAPARSGAAADAAAKRPRVTAAADGDVGMSDADAAGVAAGGAAAVEGGGAVPFEEAGSVVYLTSYKLFGLQLRDSGFRRSFLVQVLIFLQALLQPVRYSSTFMPSVELKPAHREQAAALMEEVFAALRATPDQGERFAAGVRAALGREAHYVEWKSLQKPDTQGSQGARDKALNCWDYTLPPRKQSLQEEVDAWRCAQQRGAPGAKREAASAAPGARPSKRVRAPAVDQDDEFDAPDPSRPGGVALREWLRAQPADNWAALRADQQPRFPTLLMLGGRVLRDADPDAGIEEEYKSVKQPNFRWKVARLLARRNVENVSVVPELIEEEVASQVSREQAAQLEREGVRSALLARRVARAAEEQRRAALPKAGPSAAAPSAPASGGGGNAAAADEGRSALADADADGAANGATPSEPEANGAASEGGGAVDARPAPNAGDQADAPPAGAAEGQETVASPAAGGSGEPGSGGGAAVGVKAEAPAPEQAAGDRPEPSGAGDATAGGGGGRTLRTRSGAKPASARKRRSGAGGSKAEAEEAAEAGAGAAAASGAHVKADPAEGGG